MTKNCNPLRSLTGFRAGALVSLLVAAIGCSTSVDSPRGGGSQRPPGAVASGSGGAGSTGAGSTPGVVQGTGAAPAATGGANPQGTGGTGVVIPVTPTEGPARGVLRLLTNEEYRNTIRSLLNLPTVPSDDLQPETVSESYRNGGMDGLFQPSINNHRTSWRNGQPQKPDQDPPALFNRLFGSAVPSPAPTGTAPDVAAQMAAQNRYLRRKSLLDFLMGQVTSVQAIAGAGEKAKLDAHLTALRELEKGLVDPSRVMGGGGGGVAVTPGAGCMPPTISGVPGVLNTGLADIQKVGADLTALAYQALNCDLTRVLSFMWFSSGDQVHRYNWLNISDSHHGLEHGSVDGGTTAANWVVLQRWTLGEIGKLARMLKQTTEGGGNMLDNSALLIASDMARGDHGEAGLAMPYVLLGKAGGSIKSGRQITHSPDPLEPSFSHNDLLVAVGQAVGANVTAMGDADLNSKPVALS